MTGNSEILDFYHGTNVFITGGTGFLGKILIEKLLRSTSVSTIYVLIRPKKGKDINSRLNDMFDDVLFEKLKETCPKFVHRVVGIPGDVSITDLGILEADRHTLITNVNIVFNVAATVKFDENIKLAYKINVNGTSEMLELSRQMKQLKSLLHVSTAFSNCHLVEIEEKIYDHGANYEDIGYILEKLNIEHSERYTKRLIGKWPNTYTFTKALAESLIKNESGTLPIGIFRPSVVTATAREPLEGWIDNMYGPTGIYAAVAAGLLRTINCDGTKLADLVPADTCIAALIASAWDVGTKKFDRTPENIPVYNYVSSPENPITWNEYDAISTYQLYKYPVSKTFWRAGANLTANYYLHILLRLFYHIIPGVLINVIGILCGQRFRLLKMYSKIHKMLGLMSFFSTQEWTFANDNVVKLWNKISRDEQEMFPFSMKTVLWLKYLRSYSLGIRLYIFKEPMSNLEAALRRKQVFDILHTILLGILSVGASTVLWILMKRIFVIDLC